MSAQSPEEKDLKVSERLSSTVMEKLRKNFAKEHIRTVSKKGTNLTYVSHTSVIDRLLQVDPEWSIVPAYVNPSTGAPIIDRDWITSVPIGAWFKLTVCGVEKMCYGSYEPPIKADRMKAILAGSEKWSDTNDVDFMKKIQSDAVSRGAMQFGVALQMWSPQVEFEAGLTSEELEVKELTEALKAKYPSLTDAQKEEFKTITSGRKITELALDDLRRLAEIGA